MRITPLDPILVSDNLYSTYPPNRFELEAENRECLTKTYYLEKNSFERSFEEYSHPRNSITCFFSDHNTSKVYLYLSLKSFKYDDIQKQKIINKLKSYKLYQKGWDGYEGTPPPEQAIVDSINFLERLPKSCPVPYVSLGGDGEIGFFWEIDNIFVDIGFSGDETFSYFARDKENRKFFGDDIHLSNEFPCELIKVICSAGQIT